MGRHGVMNNPVLVLNASYEPINITPVRDALKLVVKGKAVIDMEHDRMLRAGVPLPSVVRLIEFRRIPYLRVQPKSKNIFLRDNFTCQYCGVKFTHRELTLDHIKPKSHGGPDTWDNLVTCCQPCNSRKADRTPEQAGMMLLRRPKPSNMHTGRHMMRIMGGHDPKWRTYLYY